MIKTFKFGMLLFAACLLFTSCVKDLCEETRTFVQYDPIYLGLDEIRADISTESARELETPGKLYVYGQYLFINEFQEGVHIYDNSDPSNPNNIGFISIPGNIDIAVKDGYMYADNYMDMIVIDITDPLQSKLSCRFEDVYQNYYEFDNRGILTGYRETEITSVLECGDPNFNNRFFDFNGQQVGVPGLEFSNDAFSPVAGGADGGRSSVGTGGSLARFSIAKDHLYMIDEFNMYIFDVENAAKPENVDEFYVEWGIETLFARGDHMFIGANNGMHIYDISRPRSPQYVSVFRHAQACDPVFVDGDYAYVTLRGGRACESFSNQLDVVDISNIREPTLARSFEMISPQGLSVRNDRLYLCEREAGLKIFDSSDPLRVGDILKNHMEDIHAVDVIALSDELLLVIGEAGLHQFDISDKDNPQELSVITPVNSVE